jgi:hypothetical protein
MKSEIWHTTRTEGRGESSARSAGHPEIASKVASLDFGPPATTVAYNINLKVYVTVVGDGNARNPRFGLPRALRVEGRVAPV